MSMSENPGPAEQLLALEPIAMVALEAGRMLMVSGGKAAVVRQGMTLIARGLGARRTDIRVGFASIAVTVGDGSRTITRMLDFGAHGVNMRLNHALRELCIRVHRGGMTCAETGQALAALEKDLPRYPVAALCLAAGIACASFGRLLGTDWSAFVPVLVAGAIGQWIRLLLIRHGVNGFVTTGLVAFTASALAGLLSGLVGSGMVQIAMSAAVLMLVPGVPAINAQTDIMEGFPTLGSARAVSVFMVLVFLTVGIGATRILLGGMGLQLDPLSHGIAHQMLFGAIAAAGFGVLFNFEGVTLIWAGLAGAIALGVRTAGLEAGWALEAASFAAAAAVAVTVELADTVPVDIRRAGNALAVAGCIPMIPGSAAAHWIIGLFEMTATTAAEADQMLLTIMQSGLTVIFTIGAIGAGLTIVASLLRRPDFPK
ncbi:threonine/serine exporter family protein [Consotaella aegiceratis]|uniref:threonine/serine exporter family protein n=1 Tax=Consotaella aegiceratis TaxID=3097961 RepID=UPI002F42D88C